MLDTLRAILIIALDAQAGRPANPAALAEFGLTTLDAASFSTPPSTNSTTPPSTNSTTPPACCRRPLSYEEHKARFAEQKALRIRDTIAELDATRAELDAAHAELDAAKELARADPELSTLPAQARVSLANLRLEGILYKAVRNLHGRTARAVADALAIALAADLSEG